MEKRSYDRGRQLADPSDVAAGGAPPMPTAAQRPR